jgi:Membrane protein involved in the export of O-antigen and teichoic acid
MKSNLKGNVIQGLFWKFMERGGVQGIQFLIQIILARLLSPNDYGVIALISVFISIATIFVQSGFGQALVQKITVDDTDYSSVFYLNLIISTVLYIILFITAPLIAKFYSIPILSSVLKVQALTLFFGAFNAVQNAHVQRDMDFKKIFITSLGGIIIQGITGVTMAYKGYGVWALVFSTLANNLTTTIILWFVVSWRPKLLFSYEKVKTMFHYGSKLLISNLIDTIYTNIYSLTIGKLYDQKTLGYYNRGQNIPNLLVTNIDGSIQNVLFPALSAEQNDRRRLKEIMRRSIVTSTFLIFPIMIGLAIVAKPLTIILLTPKWLPAVPFMQLSCIAFSFYPIHTSNLQAINAVGRSDIFLKLEIIKKVLGISILIMSIPFGIYALVTGSVISSMLSMLINSWPNKKLFNYSFVEQLKDMLPSMGLSIIMGMIVYCVSFFNLNVWPTLALQIIVGIIVYIAGAKLFKLECLSYLINSIKEFMRKDPDADIKVE